MNSCNRALDTKPCILLLENTPTENGKKSVQKGVETDLSAKVELQLQHFCFKKPISPRDLAAEHVHKTPSEEEFGKRTLWLCLVVGLGWSTLPYLCPSAL